jgi:hypothetical protein
VFDQIWEHVSSSWTNVQVRDNEWVCWRYLDAAPIPYEVAVAWRHKNGSPQPVGYVAYRVTDHDGERRNGYIADLFMDRSDETVAVALIQAALKRLSQLGAGTVMTLAPPESVLYAKLRRSGFLPTKTETAFTFEIVPLSSDLSIEALSDPKEWHLTGGDFDVI